MNAAENYPNLLRVSQELAQCKHPYKVAEALVSMLEADTAQAQLGQDVTEFRRRFARLTPENQQIVSDRIAALYAIQQAEARKEATV